MKQVPLDLSLGPHTYISSSGANIAWGEGGVLYRGLPRGVFYRGSFKVFRRWGQVNSETGPIRHVSWTPYISSSGASLAWVWGVGVL